MSGTRAISTTSRRELSSSIFFFCKTMRRRKFMPFWQKHYLVSFLVGLRTYQLPCKLYCFWNVMAHAQKPYFVFRRNGRVHLNRRGASVQSTTGSRGVRISGSNAGYTMFRGSVKSTGYPLHSTVSPSLLHPLPSPCAITFQLDSTPTFCWFTK